MNFYSDITHLDSTLRILGWKEENEQSRYDCGILFYSFVILWNFMQMFYRFLLTISILFLFCSAASDIKGHVEAAARELSLERFANFENELYQVRMIALFFIC